MLCIIENAYSRIPIYSGSRDNIKGVLYIKDLLPHVNKGDNFRWQSLIRPAYFVPETKMIDDLLRDFQANKIHIAIVVDEFGGTSGLVTMEDIIEEIVGEIHDEYDDEERTYVVLNDHTWIFEAKTQLTDFYKIAKVDEDEFEKVLADRVHVDLNYMSTQTGPHRDDIMFMINGIDARRFGSQGQQRTVALSLKIAEIKLVKNIINDNPILLLDDVMSELDSSRREALLEEIKDIQTIITCTGYDDFIKEQVVINNVYHVINGTVKKI